MNAKDFVATKEMLDCVKNVLLCQAMVATIKPIVEAYQKDILQRHQFHIWDYATREDMKKQKTDRICLDEKDAFLISDEDFKIYDQECKKARDEAGLKVDMDEFCPLLVAENLLGKANNLLLDSMFPVTGLKQEDYFRSGDGCKTYDKAINLITSLLVAYTKEHKINLHLPE